MTAKEPVFYLDTVEDCPMQKLLSILAGPWTFYILHVLRTEGPTRFGALRRRISGISSKVLTERLRLLEQCYERTEKPCSPSNARYSSGSRLAW